MYNKYYKKYGDSQIYMIDSVNLNSSLLAPSPQANGSSISRAAQKAFQGISDSFASLATLLGRVLTALKEGLIWVYLERFDYEKNSFRKKGLLILKDAGILTQEIFTATRQHQKPIDLARAIESLNRAGILTQENFTDICNHQKPIELAKALESLNRAGILTQGNRTAVCQHQSPFELATGLLHLHRGEILTQENFTDLCNHREPSILAIALESLHGAEILSQSNRSTVCQHQRPYELTTVLSRLHQRGILTQENMTAACDHQHIEVLFFAINMIDAAQNLNQNSFTELLQRPVLLNQQTYNDFWLRSPQFLPNVAGDFDNVFQHLINLSAQANPEEAIRAYADQLIAHVPHAFDFNGALIINNNQSTHTTSVHASVSVSAIKLKEKHRSLSFEASLRALKSILETQSGMKKDAALRGLNRISELAFVDPTSQVSINDMLCFIHLESVNADVLINGLYEIQRGYNLNEQGIDYRGNDSPICASGTFNKLMETLQIAGVEEAQIIYITKQTATLKLKASIKTYCKDHSITDITDENWPRIKDSIKGELVDYRSAFASDADFELFLESGQYVDLS